MKRFYFIVVSFIIASTCALAQEIDISGAGAIINAHIPKVYFGAYDFKNGSCGTITNLFEMPYNFKPEYHGGIMEEECAKLLKDFFKKLR